MMSISDRQRAWPGMWLMIAIFAALVFSGMWIALHRTARVDDALTGDNGAAAVRWPDMRVDVNAASASELALLPGVGQRLGERIVEDRAAHGRFATLDDLNRVPGLGAATIDRLRPYAVAGAE
jgi:competence protein ComEA